MPQRILMTKDQVNRILCITINHQRADTYTLAISDESPRPTMLETTASLEELRGLVAALGVSSPVDFWSDLYEDGLTPSHTQYQVYGSLREPVQIASQPGNEVEIGYHLQLESELLTGLEPMKANGTIIGWKDHAGIEYRPVFALERRCPIKNHDFQHDITRFDELEQCGIRLLDSTVRAHETET